MTLSVSTPWMSTDAQHHALAELLRSPRYAPPLPSRVGIAALVLARRGAPSSEICSALAFDPMLQGTATFLAGAPLTTLGAPAIRDALLAAAVHLHLFRAPGFTDFMVRARSHSMAVARAAQTIADVVGQDRDDAFELGLLHDAGIGAALLAIAGAPAMFGRPMPSTLAGLVGVVHEEAGERVAAAWGTPAPLLPLIARHHDPCIDGNGHALAVVLATAEDVANEHGFAVDVGEPRACFDPPPALAGATRRRHRLDLDAVSGRHLESQIARALGTAHSSGLC